MAQWTPSSHHLGMKRQRTTATSRKVAAVMSSKTEDLLWGYWGSIVSFWNHDSCATFSNLSTHFMFVFWCTIYKFPVEEEKKGELVQRRTKIKRPFAWSRIRSGGHAGTIVAIIIRCEVAPGMDDARFCLLCNNESAAKQPARSITNQKIVCR